MTGFFGIGAYSDKLIPLICKFDWFACSLDDCGLGFCWLLAFGWEECGLSEKEVDV